MMNGRPERSHDPGRGPFGGLRRWLYRVFSSRAFLLALSFCIAVLFWSTLVASDGSLTRQKTFQGVAVGVTGDSSLRSRGLIVMDDLSELVPSVRLTVEIAQSNYDRVGAASYNPHFDLSQIEQEGENTLPVSFSSQLYGPVVSCEPSSVTVHVERYLTRRVPVVLETVGQLPDGLYLDAMRTDPTMLSVSGPQSLMASVNRAVARLDLSTLSAARMSDKTALTVELQGANGAAISSDKLEITNQSVITNVITAETDLVPCRDVPLDLDAFVTGEPAEGCALLGVECEFESLRVAGNAETLSAIPVISTDQPLDISGAAADVTGYVRIRRPVGAENALPSEVFVTARIGEQTVERTFSGVPVLVEGLPDRCGSILSSATLTARISGDYSFVENLNKEAIALSVDVSGLAPGEYTLPVNVHIDNAGNYVCSLNESEITVTIIED